MGQRVVVMGGGFSGLAAAVRLCELGHQVILLERRHHLGGRAYSFVDSKSGDIVDNGQHLFMACYRHTIDFLTRIGSIDLLRFQERARVDFLDRENGLTRFECPALPAPLHAMAGLFGLAGLTIGDKLRAVRVGRALRNQVSKHNLTVAQWLDRLGQSHRIRERFWYPLATATLNEDPEIASAVMLKQVLRLGFGGTAKESRMGVARVGLSQLYTAGARAFIEAHGGQVRTRADVCHLITQSARAQAAELRTGEVVDADHFVVAVPPNALLRLAPRELRMGEFAVIANLRTSPIVSMNLWFDRPIIQGEFVGLLGTRIQWLFNKSLIFSLQKESHQVAVVISAARDFVDQQPSELVEMALDDIRSLVPASREARLLHSRVIKERDATLAHTVDSQAWRPGTRTTIPNLFLAGDWTNTGLPATIESAVLSGNRAAEAVHAAQG